MYVATSIENLTDDEIIDMADDLLGFNAENAFDGNGVLIAKIIDIVARAMNEASALSDEMEVSSATSFMLLFGYMHGIYRTAMVKIEEDYSKEASDYCRTAFDDFARLGQYHALLKRLYEIMKKRAN